MDNSQKFLLDCNSSSNKDDKGKGEYGKERGKDDVRLLLNLLRSRHLANCGVAQHQDELETEGKYDYTRFELSDVRYAAPDEEGGEEAATDPNV